MLIFQVHSKTFDLDIRNDGFGKCISFQIIAIIVKIIYLKFQVVMVYMYDALMCFCCIFVIEPYTLPKFNSKMPLKK